jgi:PAS domain S-box-containing protein
MLQIHTAPMVPRPNDTLEHSLLSAWLEVSDIGLCVLDDASLVVMVNGAAAGMLQTDAAAAHNAPLEKLLENFDDSAKLMPWLAAPDLDGQQHITKTGSAGTQHFLLKTRTIHDGAGARFKMLSFTDITSVLQAKQLEENRRQWQAMNAGVVISDALAPDMPVVYVNPMFEAMSGFSSAEMVGRNCRHLQGAETNQPGIAKIRHAISQQTNGYAVLRNFRKDGSLFINELFISPIKDASGKVTHFMGIQHLRDEDFSLEKS